MLARDCKDCEETEQMLARDGNNCAETEKILTEMATTAQRLRRD